jgi:hypothetical protein
MGDLAAPAGSSTEDDMATLEGRVTELERKVGGYGQPLLVFEAPGGLTDEQRAEVEHAEQAGRQVILVTWVRGDDEL